MNLRTFDHDADYPMLVSWWEGHKAITMPAYILPAGWVAELDGQDYAAAFLYLDQGGRFAVIEWLTTNPAVRMSRHLVEAVRALLVHIEEVARARGCKFIISFVVPDTGEERLYQRTGYATSEGPAHRIYAKPLAA